MNLRIDKILIHLPAQQAGETESYVRVIPKAVASAIGGQPMRTGRISKVNIQLPANSSPQAAARAVKQSINRKFHSA